MSEITPSVGLCRYQARRPSHQGHFGGSVQGWTDLVAETGSHSDFMLLRFFRLRRVADVTTVSGMDILSFQSVARGRLGGEERIIRH